MINSCVPILDGVQLLGFQSAKPKHLKGKKTTKQTQRNLLIVLPFRCLALCFTTDCKEAMCPDLTEPSLRILDV